MSHETEQLAIVRSGSRLFTQVAADMKRSDLIRHVEQCGCEQLREGRRHTVYVNRSTRKSSSVPRHREVNDYLARKICEDLQIPPK